ncbi:hypothetical protein BFJ66_g996 [Fusarium oxysporum f. sp. cepae]|uniref:Uncharacterized protein n=1 Tax=Fusarium oxysporum f. sp. cepae TaxID=396571 RepID=A0A3L6NIM1_FUSOX|nr:hypothetical protein BFJ65_g8379 [Fusarium oxysporum f. sp. cepae]RKK62188.1 hypothetical protein BFJ66_g996 [Fusarium oxysporum f. sp. cepae]
MQRSPWFYRGLDIDPMEAPSLPCSKWHRVYDLDNSCQVWGFFRGKTNTRKLLFTLPGHKGGRSVLLSSSDYPDIVRSYQEHANSMDNIPYGNKVALKAWGRGKNISERQHWPLEAAYADTHSDVRAGEAMFNFWKIQKRDMWISRTDFRSCFRNHADSIILGMGGQPCWSLCQPLARGVEDARAEQKRAERQRAEGSLSLGMNTQPSPATNVQPPPITSFQPPPATSVQPPPVTSVQPPPVTSFHPPPATNVQPPPITSFQPPPATSVQPPPVTNVQPLPMINIQPPPVTSFQPPPATATNVQPPPVTDVQPPPAANVQQNLHPYSSYNFQKPQYSQGPPVVLYGYGQPVNQPSGQVTYSRETTATPPPMQYYSWPNPSAWTGMGH